MITSFDKFYKINFTNKKDKVKKRLQKLYKKDSLYNILNDTEFLTNCVKWYIQGDKAFSTSAEKKKFYKSIEIVTQFKGAKNEN